MAAPVRNLLALLQEALLPVQEAKARLSRAYHWQGEIDKAADQHAAALADIKAAKTPDEKTAATQARDTAVARHKEAHRQAGLRVAKVQTRVAKDTAKKQRALSSHEPPAGTPLAKRKNPHEFETQAAKQRQVALSVTHRKASDKPGEPYRPVTPSKFELLRRATARMAGHDPQAVPSDRELLGLPDLSPDVREPTNAGSPAARELKARRDAYAASDQAEFERKQMKARQARKPRSDKRDY